MPMWRPETLTFRALEPSGKRHVLTWTDDHIPGNREVSLECSCGFTEGPAAKLTVGVKGHLKEVGALLLPY